MGVGPLYSLLSSVFSNSAVGLLVQSSSVYEKGGYSVLRDSSDRHQRPKGATPHFFILSASDVSILLAGVSLMMTVTALGFHVQLVLESMILFSFSLLACVGLMWFRGSAKENIVYNDILLGSLVALIIWADQSQRYQQDYRHFNLAAHLSTFMFCLSGIRRAGLLAIWIVGQMFRLTITATILEYSPWLEYLTILFTDFLCLAYGLCINMIVYYTGTEILRTARRPRIALQDFPPGTIQAFELAVFTYLKNLQEQNNDNGSQSQVDDLSKEDRIESLGGGNRSPVLIIPELDSGEHLNVLFHIAYRNHHLSERKLFSLTRTGNNSTINLISQTNKITHTNSLTNMTPDDNSSVHHVPAAKAAALEAATATTSIDGSVAASVAARRQLRKGTRQKTVTFQTIQPDALTTMIKQSDRVRSASYAGQSPTTDIEIIQSEILSDSNLNEFRRPTIPSSHRRSVSFSVGENNNIIEETKRQRKLRREKQRAQSVALRGNAMAFLLQTPQQIGYGTSNKKPGGGDQKKTNAANKPNAQKPNRLDRVARSARYWTNSSIPLELNNNYRGNRISSFVFDRSMETVLDEINSIRFPINNIRRNWFGQFSDTKVERWFICWKQSISTRLFFVSFKWILTQQVLTTLAIFSAIPAALLPVILNPESRDLYYPVPPTIGALALTGHAILHVALSIIFLSFQWKLGKNTAFDWPYIATYHTTRARLFAFWLIIGSFADFAIMEFLIAPITAQEIPTTTTTNIITPNNNDHHHHRSDSLSPPAIIYSNENSLVWKCVPWMIQLSVLPFLLNVNPFLNGFINSTIIVISVALHLIFTHYRNAAEQEADFPPHPDGSLLIHDIFPLLAGVVLQQFLLAKPLDENFRRIFAHYALPYLLYLEGLKPPENSDPKRLSQNQSTSISLDNQINRRRDRWSELTTAGSTGGSEAYHTLNIIGDGNSASSHVNTSDDDDNASDPSETGMENSSFAEPLPV